MAFVGGLGLGSAATAQERVGTCEPKRPSRVAAVSMSGYGDYSYATDKTQGHTNNYYIDKFRVAGDFSKGISGKKAGEDIPVAGIPQLEGPLGRQPDAPEDPRIAEASGELYFFDPNFKTEEELEPEVDEETVINTNFVKFRSQSAAERIDVLSTLNFAAKKRESLRLQSGASEKKFLTFSGQLENRAAQAERKKAFPMFTPYGAPQTEIPGTEYVGSIGAADYMDMATAAGESSKLAGGVADPVYKEISAADDSIAPEFRQLGSA